MSIWTSLFTLVFFNDDATAEIYRYGHTLSLHGALPISMPERRAGGGSGEAAASRDVARPARRAQVRSVRHGRARGNGHEQRTRLRTCANRSEEHTSELQSLMRISYAVFCLKKQIEEKHT